MSGRNALIKCIKFLHDVLDYSFNQGLILASVAVDLRSKKESDERRGQRKGAGATSPVGRLSGSTGWRLRR